MPAMSTTAETAVALAPEPAPPPAARGAAAYRRRLTPKQMEAEVFVRANRAIQQAASGLPLDRARAVADNRRLWDAVRMLVLDPSNTLPPPLRGQIASIAQLVVRECEGEAPDLGFIAEMNEQFAAALWH
jgi:flagellar biosynthesis regulator FlaF